MTNFIINGGHKLSGTVKISGAKNAILPILAATLLTDSKIIISNVPDLSDVHNKIKLLAEIGSKAYFDKDKSTVTIEPKDSNVLIPKIINNDLASTVRTSSLFMGPLLARLGSCTLPMPGGCKIGHRMLDLHFMFLSELGASNQEEADDFIHLNTNGDRLTGNIIHFPKVSVGATQNLLMAATLAHGQTIMTGCATEPEVSDLANFLVTIGADISGIGTDILTINGKEQLGQSSDVFEYSIINDRIQAGSYALAALMTRGEILLKGIKYEHSSYFFKILEATGASIKEEDDGVLVSSPDEPANLYSKSIVTAPWPNFPTDLQQLYVSYMTITHGQSIVEEMLFENRFNSARELLKMGAKIYFDENDAQKICVEGIDALSPSDDLIVHDMRGGVALMLAALATKGTSVIKDENDYIARGYDNLLEKLKKLGAHISVQ